ncbi:hypothetical protein TNCV_1048461 [Trichonephila clavipes]|nr:hypothetical protein TNCV_1048461 [Trichonephila clavipes]
MPTNSSCQGATSMPVVFRILEHHTGDCTILLGSNQTLRENALRVIRGLPPLFPFHQHHERTCGSTTIYSTPNAAKITVESPSELKEGRGKNHHRERGWGGERISMVTIRKTPWHGIWTNRRDLFLCVCACTGGVRREKTQFRFSFEEVVRWGCVVVGFEFLYCAALFRSREFWNAKDQLEEKIYTR